MNTTRPELRGSFGMAATTHWLASGTAMSVLERGGNAFDAAVAAGFVLQVVLPHLNGPGGDLPIVLYAAERDEVLVVDGQGPAPAAATIERFRSLGLDLVPGTGLLAACVPGAFDGWMLLLRDFGTWRPREVLEYAIGYADQGYPVAPGMAAAICGVERLFREDWPTSSALYLAGGAPATGSTFRNLRLAETYRRIVREAEAAGSDREAQIGGARDSFYRGFVADAIAAFSATTEVCDSSGRVHRGLLTAPDLATWRAGIERPISLDYRGYRVFKTGPWGQGPVFLQQLALLDGFDMDGMELNGADWIHAIVECAKLAFADREAWYGDPAFVDVPLDALLDPAYNAERRRLVSDAASPDLRPGSPLGREPRLPRGAFVGPTEGLPDRMLDAPPEGSGEPGRVAREAVADRTRGAGRRRDGQGGVLGPSHGDTVHVAVADRHGNLVSCMPSGGWLQSSPTIPDLGFCLGTRAQMFWLEEGLASSLAPGKRPRTTLSPGLVTRDGRPYLAFGSPGGDSQDQWALTFFLAHVHHGLGIQAAIDAPTFHTEHFPSSFHPRRPYPRRVHVEDRVHPDVIGELRRRGHDVRLEPGWALGHLCAVGRDDVDATLMAGATSRDGVSFATGR